jgi:FKBP-type peptidyl-prolyl cis-trans isomerase FkpA
MNRGISVAVALAVAVSVVGCQQKAAPVAASPSPGALATEQDKTVYAVGLMMGRNLEQLDLTPAELEIVKKGLADSASGRKGEVELETYGPKVQEFAQSRVAARAKGEKEKAKAFADSAAQESGAVRTTSGLVFKSLQPGHGATPAATDTVKVNYSGKLTNGTEFDSTAKHGGKPAEFKLNQVVPCWTEGVQRMKVGEKARLVCPSDIAYGDAGSPPVIPGGATLVFEIELLDVKK